MSEKPSAVQEVSWSAEITGAAVSGVVAVAYAMSYGALLFPGALHDLLPLGIGLCLVNAAVGAFWLSWRSQLPLAIGGPDGNTTSLMAAMSATVLAGTVAGSTQQNVLWLLIVTTLVCAMLFLALGFSRMGLAVRYVPYPVVGGFLASTGWLVVAGALRVVAQLPTEVAFDLSPKQVLRPQVFVATAFAFAMLWIFRVRRSPLVLPSILVLGSLAVHIVLSLAGTSAQAARAAGWLFEVGQPARWLTPFSVGAGEVDWEWIASQWVDMLAVAAVAAISILLSSSGLEVLCRRDVSLDKELKEHGWLNIATALLGGYLSLVSLSRTAVLMDSHVRTRVAGMLCALVCAAALAGASWLLESVPRVVLGGFLLYLGLSILREWLVDVRHRVGRADWLLIIMIVAITVTVGFTVAVFAGVVISTLNFAVNYSRVGVVQHDVDGAGLRSTVQRPAAQRDLLTREGASIRVLVLRGVIFFGTAYALLERVRPFVLPSAGSSHHVLVLDFSHAASADSSAALTFTKFSNMAAEAGVRIVVAGLQERTRQAVLQGMRDAVVTATLDQALDKAEELLLRSHGIDPLGAREPIDTWLLRELGSTHAPKVRALLERRTLAAGETLMRHGDKSDATLYVVESGRLSVTLPGQQDDHRLATLMAGNIAGEMALYDDAQRSATVTAEQDTVIWALRRSALESLHPAAIETAMRVHALMMRTLAERVKQANAAAAALQRGV